MTIMPIIFMYKIIYIILYYKNNKNLIYKNIMIKQKILSNCKISYSFCEIHCWAQAGLNIITHGVCRSWETVGIPVLQASVDKMDWSTETVGKRKTNGYILHKTINYKLLHKTVQQLMFFSFNLLNELQLIYLLI